MEQGEELKIDYDAVEAALQILGEAVAEFAEINDGIFNTDLNNMNGMNANFVEAFAPVLKEVPYTISMAVVNMFERFQMDVNIQLNELRMIDEAYSCRGGEGSNG